MESHGIKQGWANRAATCLRQLTPPIGGFLGVFQNLKPPGLKAATQCGHLAKKRPKTKKTRIITKTDLN